MFRVASYKHLWLPVTPLNCLSLVSFIIFTQKLINSSNFIKMYFQTEISLKPEVPPPPPPPPKSLFAHIKTNIIRKSKRAASVPNINTLGATGRTIVCKNSKTNKATCTYNTVAKHYFVHSALLQFFPIT